MIREVLRCLRLAAASKVFRRGAQHACIGMKRAGHELRVGKVPDTKRCLEAFVDQIDDAVFERQIDIYVGVLLQKLRKGRRQPPRTKSNRRRDPQRSARRSAQLADRAVPASTSPRILLHRSK